MNWDWSFVRQILPELLIGVAETVLVTLVCAAIALVGGLIISVITQVTGRPGRWIMRPLIELARGIPILVLLYFGFYALPGLGMTLPAFFVGALVLGVVYAAYCSEVYRAGLEAIPPGIRDACRALGLPMPVMWLRVLIPLAIRRSIPALVNYLMILYKQSALLFAIGVPILLARAQVIGYESFRYLEPYTVAAVLYLLLNLPFVYLLRRFEVNRAVHATA
ncbi:amino acid ABC transporter permease [Amycolatopsis sp. 3B14]|uniref:amino acid ABC transporter permease n=1 Tax=Amycolatopsis sp. 3B14 TaxID=3243600 RepID=UPI003D96433E